MLVVDYGAQYAQLIARRVREANVYSEVVPHTYSTEQLLAKNPAAIILSGGPSSVYAEGAPSVGADLFEAGIPVFGICYGFQAMANALGGKVAQTGLREYGATETTAIGEGRSILAGMPQHQSTWMSHGDSVHEAPEGFEVLATTAGAEVAAFANEEKCLYGVQWHPEVKHSAYGQQVLENFLFKGAKLEPNWTAGKHPGGTGRPHPRTGRRRPGHLRAVRRRRLRRRCRPRPARRRRPADLRLRGPRSAARRRSRAG